MNRALHRLIFNAARGCLMAVAEVAHSCGKAASGEGWAGGGLGGFQASNRPPARVNIAQAPIKVIAFAAAALVFAPLALQAQVVADPSAAGGVNPQIFTTANGITQVNLQSRGCPHFGVTALIQSSDLHEIHR